MSKLDFGRQSLLIEDRELSEEARKAIELEKLRKAQAQYEKNQKAIQGSVDYHRQKTGVKDLSFKDIKAHNQAKFKAAQALKAKKLDSFKKGGDMKLAPSDSPKKDIPKDSSKGGDNTSKTAAAMQLAQQTGLAPKNGAAGGVMSGAIAGSAFGPEGALIGGTIGGISGGLQAKAANKRRLAEIESNKFKALGNIEVEKADKINRALENLQKSFEASLLSQGQLRLF